MLGLSFVSAQASVSTQTLSQSVNPARAWQDFYQSYWDANRQYFFAYSDHIGRNGTGPKAGTYADFWWEAQLWDLTMDAVQSGIADKAMIDSIFEGFNRENPDWYNDFNDDLGWWALAATRAYKITEKPVYLERAKSLFDDIWTYWDETYGGGVWWRRRGERQKNVATNAPLVATAVRLFQVTGEQKYLDDAKKIWAWLETSLFAFPRVYDNIVGANELRRWDFSYNYGNAIVAALAMYEVEHDPSYLEKAKLAADWVMTNLTNNGVLLSEGTGDGGGFKGVFVRRLHDLAVVTNEDRYWRALQANAISAWNARRSDGLTGDEWQSQSPPERPLEALTVSSAVAVILNAKPPFESFAAGNGIYEAENSERGGVESSATAPGFTARGYVNHFFKTDQGVTFHVATAQAATYSVTLRYSAGGGNVSRLLQINNGSPTKIDLPATNSWLEWQEVNFKLDLPQGFSSITVFFKAGSKGYLNLDHLRLKELP